MVGLELRGRRERVKDTMVNPEGSSPCHAETPPGLLRGLLACERNASARLRCLPNLSTLRKIGTKSTNKDAHQIPVKQWGTPHRVPAACDIIISEAILWRYVSKPTLLKTPTRSC